VGAGVTSTPPGGRRRDIHAPGWAPA